MHDKMKLVTYTQYVQYIECIKYIQYTQYIECIKYIQYTHSTYST